jgi:hypothetical protein
LIKSTGLSVKEFSDNLIIPLDKPKLKAILPVHLTERKNMKIKKMWVAIAVITLAASVFVGLRINWGTHERNGLSKNLTGLPGCSDISDKYIDSFISAGGIDIAISILNKTEEGVKVNWEEISFIPPSGMASKTLHGSCVMGGLNTPQPPSIIPPHAKIVDFLVPAESFYYDKKYERWKTRDLSSYIDKASQNNNTFGIYLPLEIKGQKKEYNFVFRINKMTEIKR